MKIELDTRQPVVLFVEKGVPGLYTETGKELIREFKEPDQALAWARDNGMRVTFIERGIPKGEHLSELLRLGFFDPNDKKTIQR